MQLWVLPTYPSQSGPGGFAEAPGGGRRAPGTVAGLGIDLEH
jgi:hypothetical protein